ncbi:uncharacterized protein [Montipora capricornis]|uniref:uncharacterized protein isoform X2 n=1 Tax=Montipora capricornis TaxID=246305 RepID=UPI0035F1C51D
MLQYHGRPGDLNAKSANSGSSNAHRRGTFALIPPEREKQARPSSESTCQLTRAKTRFRREEKIRINVSGKRYHLTQTQLQRFPESLLADPAKRGIYYDAETEEIFFDRNQTAFESVFNFYATKGRFIFPKRTLSGQLIADELHFFGVYEYLDLEDRKYNLPLPRRLQEKKTIAPRNALQKVLWQMCEDPDSMYYCEEVDDRTVFRSIPDACWWAVVTITTLGYGDMIPTTFAGKLVGGICCLSGVFLITPLLPIIYNKFDRFQRLEQNKTKARYHYRPSIKVKGSPLVEERVQEFAPVETGQRQE